MAPRKPKQLQSTTPELNPNGQSTTPQLQDAVANKPNIFATPMNPNQSNPAFTPPIGGGGQMTTSDAQAQVQALSAITGQPLVPNRVNKFFLPQGEVTEQEFRRAKGEAKITTEQGGRSELNQGGGLLPETRKDLLDVNRETLTPELQGALAGIGEDTFAGEEAISEQELNTSAGKFVGSTALLAIPTILLSTLKGKADSLSLGKVAAVGGTLAASRGVQRSKIADAKAFTDTSKANIDDYVNAFKAGDMSYTDAVQQIQTEIMNIRRNEKSIKVLNQALGNWISGGADEAAEIEQYIRHFNTIVYPDLVNSAQNRALGIK